MKSVRLIVPLLALVLALPALAGAVLVMGTAQTVAGRFFAVGLMAAAVAVMLLTGAVAAQRRRRKAMRRLGLVHLLGAAGLLGICYALSPDGEVPEGSRLRSEWGGEAEFQRGSLGNLIPEVDQVAAALWLFPYFDNAAPQASVERLRLALMRNYYALDGDRGFSAAASALPATFREQIRMPVEGDHVFSYLPAAAGDGGASGHEVALPVVIYLHGDWGNLKAGIWNWKGFADASGYAMVAPTRTAASWDSDGGMRAVRDALEVVRGDARLDAGRVVLVGYAAGATGLPRAAVEFAGAFESFIFISSEMGPAVLRSARLREEWKGKRVLFVHGEQDLRSPLPALQKDIGALRDQEIEVFLQVFPGEDQFLFWTRSDDLFALIGDWLD
ncbi:hypothetical protein BH23VER1_BH23VER1_27930 [soil metagenome]